MTMNPQESNITMDPCHNCRSLNEDTSTCPVCGEPGMCPDCGACSNPECAVHTPVWDNFTKRTNDPKLSWLEAKLSEQHIPHRRNGESFHAPILQVPTHFYGSAWAILEPADDLPDDHPMFNTRGHYSA